VRIDKSPLVCPGAGSVDRAVRPTAGGSHHRPNCVTRLQPPINPATDSHQCSAKHGSTHRRKQLTTDTVYKHSSRTMMCVTTPMGCSPRIRSITGSEFVGGIPVRGQGSYTAETHTINSIGYSSTLSPVTIRGRHRTWTGQPWKGTPITPTVAGYSRAVREHACSGQLRRSNGHTQRRVRPATTGDPVLPRRTTEIA
jgi:hypothetical protein